MRTKKNLLTACAALVICLVVILFSSSIQGRSYEISPIISLPEYRTDAARAIDAYERLMDRFMNLTEQDLTSIDADIKDVAAKLVLIDYKLTDISTRMAGIEKALGIQKSIKPVEKSSKVELSDNTNKSGSQNQNRYTR